MANIRSFADFNLDDILINPDDIEPQDEEALDNVSQKDDEEDEYEPDYENDFEEQSEYLGSPPASVSKNLQSVSKNDRVFGNIQMASDLMVSVNNSNDNEYANDSYHSYKSEEFQNDEHGLDPSPVVSNPILSPVDVNITDNENNPTSPSTLSEKSYAASNANSNIPEESNQCGFQEEHIDHAGGVRYNADIENQHGNIHVGSETKELKKIDIKPARDYQTKLNIKDKKILSPSEQLFQTLSTNSIPIQTHKKVVLKNVKDVPIRIHSATDTNKLLMKTSNPSSLNHIVKKLNIKNKEKSNCNMNIDQIGMNELDQYINKTVDAKINKYINQQQKEQILFSRLAKSSRLVSSENITKCKIESNKNEKQLQLQNSLQHDRNYKYNVEYMNLLKCITGTDIDNFDNMQRTTAIETGSNGFNSPTKGDMGNSICNNQSIVSSRIQNSNTNSNSNTNTNTPDKSSIDEKTKEIKIKSLNLHDFLALDTIDLDQFIRPVSVDHHSISKKTQLSNERIKKLKQKTQEKTKNELQYIFHSLRDSSEDIYSQFITDVIDICKKRANDSMSKYDMNDPTQRLKSITEISMHRSLAQKLLNNFSNEENIHDYRNEMILNGLEMS